MIYIDRDDVGVGFYGFLFLGLSALEGLGAFGGLDCGVLELRAKGSSMLVRRSQLFCLKCAQSACVCVGVILWGAEGDKYQMYICA